jgi:hypothetical protein
MLCRFALYPLRLLERHGRSERGVRHLDRGARCVREASIVDARDGLRGLSCRLDLEEHLLGHVLATQDAQAAELHPMFTGLDDDDDRLFSRRTPGNDIARLDIPGIEGALDRGVPGAKARLGLRAECIYEVDKRITEETSAAGYIKTLGNV